MRRPLALLAAAVVLTAFAVLAGLHAQALRADQPPANLAVTDTGLTGQVTRQVTAAVDTIFSYSYANPKITSQAAQRLLTGTAIRQYNQLFKLVEQKAPAEKLVLHTKVTNVGVELLTPGHARLLVFVNQQDRAASGKAVYSGSMFAVTAVLEHGHWLIENLSTFATSN